MKFKKEIKEMNTNGFVILDIIKYKNELLNSGLLVENMFQEALNNTANTSRFEHFASRPERGSLDLDILPEVESSIKKIIKNSIVSEFAIEYWKTNKLMYSKDFSKFRYVDPNNLEQLKYADLHYDAQFLRGKSINVCIPFSGYGGPYPGLEIYKKSKVVKLIRNTFNESQAKKYLKLFIKKSEPFAEVGKCLCFTQDTYHKRSVENKTKTRINLEFRIFPSNNIEFAGNNAEL